MNKVRFVAFFTAALCAAAMVGSALAVGTRASEKIKTYDVEVTATSAGELEIEFSVKASGTMTKLGCENITVYRQSGGSWLYCTEYSEDRTGMSKTNAASHSNTMYYDSLSGTTYKVYVTVFAENSSGRDTRTEIFTVTGK